MCLDVTPEEIGQIEFKDGKVVCYKVLCFKGGELLSPFYNADWKPGFVDSSRHDKLFGALTNSIRLGIHVLLDREKCEDAIEDMCRCVGPKTCWAEAYRVVPVICFEEDLIAVGSWSTFADYRAAAYRAAAFMRVYLSQKDYDRAKERK